MRDGSMPSQVLAMSSGEMGKIRLPNSRPRCASGCRPLGTDSGPPLTPDNKCESDGRASQTFERSSLNSQRTERHRSVEVGRPAVPLQSQSGG